MANDIRVVVPDDIGSTIQLSIKEYGKYDVNVANLDLPAGVESLTLVGSTLNVQTNKGEKTVDLAPLIPTIVAEVFLKDVQRQGNNIVFTVGEKDDSANDNSFTIDVSDLLPVQSDNVTISGDGTTGNTLTVNISSESNNALLRKGDGLYVKQPDAVEPRPIRLVNASGDTVVGYIYSTE